MTRKKSALKTHPLSDIAKASYDGDFTREHDVGGAFDAINKRFAATVIVVKFGLCDRVVDIDGGNFELAIAEGFVEVVHACGGLFGNSTDVCTGGVNGQVGNNNKRWRGTLKVLRVFFVYEVSEIATVVEDHVEGLSTCESGDCLVDAPCVLFLCLAFPGKDGYASSGNAASDISGMYMRVRRCGETHAAAAWSWVEKMF